jgi:mRNA-degrading endonuclease toxin of MazEF toxin-antitoxin module
MSTTLCRRSHETGRRHPCPLSAPLRQRGKKRPAVVVQSDVYAGTVSTVVVAEVTKNLTMKDDPACLFIKVGTPEGKARGLLIDSVVSSLVVDTVYTDTVAQVLGSLSPSLLQKFDDCLKVGLGLP